MDSARPEVLDFYRQHGAEVIDLSEDQDTTDLHKCLAYIGQHFSREQLQRLHILVLGALMLPLSEKLSIKLPLLTVFPSDITAGVPHLHHSNHMPLMALGMWTKKMS
jgi:thiamine pyrophosphokinase